MRGWSSAPLGEITRVVGGTTPATSDSENYGGDVVWVTPVDLGRLRDPEITGSARTITDAARKRVGLELLPVGTVVMSSRAPIGHLGVAAVALCTNQGCKSFVPGARIDSWFLYYTLRFRLPNIRALGAGATFAEVSKSDLERFVVPFPSIQEQRRIAGELNEQLTHVSKAQVPAVDRISLARRLGLLVLAEAYHASRDWPRRRLGDVTDGRRSPSVTSDGDTEVATVTSGCLTPLGFSFDGIRSGRMSSRDAIDGEVAADEVLVSRSNTETLVGRASRYPGGPGRVVASDLVFRIVPDPSFVTADYLANYLSVLQIQGYWRDRSSGASSTMKKITKALLSSVDLPIPPLHEQLGITAELRKRLAAIDGMEASIRAEREAIEAIPAALLRRAFEDLVA